MLFEIPQVKHAEPSSIDEALQYLVKFGSKAKIIAGGSDLLGLVKDGVEGPSLQMPEVLISISKIPGLGEIGYGRDGLKIGAGATLSELEKSDVVKEKYGILSQAAGSVATLQIRNVGTVGGNLCQRPWCWYFRHPLFPCFKKGGKLCYAITGEHKYYFSTLGLGTCVMSHPSDLAPALLALDCTVGIAGPGGRKSVPIGGFFNGPKEVADNVLKPDEILTDIQVSRNFEGAKGAYLKDRIRGAWDLSLASAAVLLKVSNGVCTDARITLGGLAPYPYRAEPAEAKLRDNPVTEDTAAEASEKAMEMSKSLPMTKYKIQLGQTIIKRAILAASRRK